MAEQKTCGYTAYDVKKASQPPGVEYVRTINHNEQGNYSGKGVIARMKISQPKGHSTAFFLATDNFFGPVLCPIKMHSRFDEHSTVLEVFKIIHKVLIFLLRFWRFSHMNINIQNGLFFPLFRKMMHGPRLILIN